jgi:hypothetical protein
MVDLFWAYENARVRDAGALPPEPLDLAYGSPDGPPPQDLQRAAALGRPVTPADCGPVRVISRYGFAVRCPRRTVLRRAARPVRERIFTDSTASYGHVEVCGDPWPTGDSGFVASWISGSEYVKLQTGVMIFFPSDMYLYQGPLPNSQLLDNATADVMAGLEYPGKERLRAYEGGSLAWSSINVIARLPPLGCELRIDAGDPLAWVFPVPSRTAVRMTRMPLPDHRRDSESTEGIEPS